MSTLPPPQDLPSNAKRHRILVVIALIFITVAFVFVCYWVLFARFYEETDNAYVQGRVVQVTPQLAGTVQAIYVDDTDRVEVGQLLLKLDPADARVALAQAEAQLAQAVRQARTLFAGRSQASAVVVQREAELVRAKEDLARRLLVAQSGAIAREELKHAQAAEGVAQGAVDAAREQLASALAMTEGTTAREHPTVQQAAAAVREAWLALKRTTLVAPIAGQVAKRSAQIGQRVAPGAPLMAIVPLHELWVDANFKESQLKEMRIGQPVTLVSDLYGSDVKFSGKLVGLAAGTGGAFSLLPAQNATGNWIKVVQRVPVRIALDSRQLAEHPLRIGLSMRAEVDLRDRDGPPLAATPIAPAGREDDAEDPAVSARIESIIAKNLK